MTSITGFAEVAAPDARVLILGSMPGDASLVANEYYAHPRNAFWPIMGALFDAGPELPYAERLERLRRRRIALWDVVHRCVRPGSLDARIERDSVEANDFSGLFHHAPRVAAVFFNGRAAETLYRRHVMPLRPAAGRRIEYHALPSTSPAHAAMSRDDKLARWAAVSELLERLSAHG